MFLFFALLRDRIKQFGIMNYELFLIYSESKAAFPQLFHELYITHMFQKRIMKFLKMTKLQQKQQSNHDMLLLPCLLIKPAFFIE